jgi:tetratricopeptide (TPR) repeat protein
MKKIILLILLTGLQYSIIGQAVTLPPSGDNQKCAVTQNIGAMVKVSVNYSSPDVTGPDGADRTGKIWGTSVAHYGMMDLGFGTSKAAPWRAGANESTTIYFSHDVLVEGKPLAAGKYGLFLILAENGPWTWIFSKNTTSWGSFFYDPREDVLRVESQPMDHPHTEWLTYTFTERGPDKATLELQWERKSVPMHITVPNMNDLYITQIDKEFQSSVGFTASNFTAAANYLLEADYNLPKALEWVDLGMNYPFFGRTDFASLTTRAQILMKMDKTEEAMASIEKAMHMPGVDAGQVHQLGRSMIGIGKKEEALKVFTMNYEANKGAWPTNVGMARGLSAVSRYEEAIKYATAALAEAPDQVNKDSLTKMIEKLKANQDVN